MSLPLEGYYGACSEARETCVALARVVADRRVGRSDSRENRVRRVADALEPGNS
ncbi:hypothetical protein [Natrinema sp. 1APR25-10V2]|uniref:hypothetical protein n=1 Tax=Natrinema sp. 1APR25-10V2 TaxID=2951081 RepID=UPI0028767F5D|nr:hypothetical protein [Natrinema sp. 1APR25-10V2]MDS0474472.1 hypothetical protein [Natrinema sp. 1APR25-10V2]